MKILISNDDGYRARGIHCLARILSQLGEVTVVAPKYHQSAMSMAVSLGMKKLASRELPEEGPGRWAYLDATPVSCVKFGLEYYFDNRNPDLVVCGINHGSNASMGANYSATLGGAEEGAINGIRSIGVSLIDYRPEADFSAVEAWLPGIVQTLLEHWPKRFGIYYNVNFPAIPAGQIRGVKVARQGRGHWIKEFEPWDDTRGELPRPDLKYFGQTEEVPLEEGERAYCMKGLFVDDEPETGDADHKLIDEGWITIVPFSVDLTDEAEFERLKTLIR